MATLNLGRIKPVFRGAYAGGTAYVVDDIVTSGDETFICILASTGNATSNATYWTKLAAKGTDGTDVGTTLTTQGDILFRDGSGLQRLAKPASNKLLQNTSGGVLSWESVSSDVVKLASAELTTGTSINLEGVFDDATYRGYKLQTYYHLDDQEQLRCRLLNSSTAYTGASDYRRWATSTYRQLNNVDSTLTHWNDGDGIDHMRTAGWSFSEKSTARWLTTWEFVGRFEETVGHKVMLMNTLGLDTSTTNYGFNDFGGYYFYNTGKVDGFQMYTLNGSNVNYLDYTLWGYKK